MIELYFKKTGVMGKKTILIFIFSLTAAVSYVPAEGVWESFSNGNYITNTAVDDAFICCAISGGVIRWDTRNKSYEKFTTENELIN